MAGGWTRDGVYDRCRALTRTPRLPLRRAISGTRSGVLNADSAMLGKSIVIEDVPSSKKKNLSQTVECQPRRLDVSG